MSIVVRRNTVFDKKLTDSMHERNMSTRLPVLSRRTLKKDGGCSKNILLLAIEVNNFVDTIQYSLNAFTLLLHLQRKKMNSCQFMQ